MSNEYLLESARIMGLCLTGSANGLTVNPEIDSESLIIYLTVACVTLGNDRTRRIVLDEKFSDKNIDYQSSVRKLDSLFKEGDRHAVRVFLRELLLVGENRKAIVNAGMDAKVLEYLIQDAAELTSRTFENTPDPGVLSNKLKSPTKGVCEEAKIHIDRAVRNKRFDKLDKALKVLGGAAARITAAKLTGGVSEILNKLGEVAIDRGLD